MILQKLAELSGRGLAHYLTREVNEYRKFSAHRIDTLEKVMLPGDVLLVEGDHRISSAIKYLTQSTWSHSAFFVGREHAIDQKFVVDPRDEAGENAGSELMLIEADLENGVIAVPLDKYADFNIRICRPFNLAPEELQKVCHYMIDSLGLHYDLKNITDLARYLLPQPPVPKKWRRRMLALGSADPTRAICSSLIAKAFQLVQYPILPDILNCGADHDREEILHIRHHSLFAPKDFDVSPYFQIIKPTLETGFDYRSINWHPHSDEFLATGEKDFDCQLCKEWRELQETDQENLATEPIEPVEAVKSG